MYLITVAFWLFVFSKLIFNSICAAFFSFFFHSEFICLIIIFFPFCLAPMLSSTMAAILRTLIYGLLWNIVELDLFQT